MSKKSTSAPGLNRQETTLGFCYWMFQLVLLPSVLSALNSVATHPLTAAELNFTFFLINFMVVICLFHRFLSNSLSHAVGNPVDFFEGLVLGAVALALCTWAMRWAIGKLDPGFVNRNDASIAALSKGGRYLLMVGTVILVPVAEECFYRGLIFRTLWKTSRLTAYLVSIAVFSAVHILGFVRAYSPLGLLLSFLQYVPAGLCLAWSYSRSGTICAPILIHALVNYYGVTQLR